MENYIKEITPEMTLAVNELKARNFADATPEEIELYAQWSSIQRLQQEEFELNRQTRITVSEARAKSIQDEKEAAINALNSLTELAQAKLKAVENGI